MLIWFIVEEVVLMQLLFQLSRMKNIMWKMRRNCVNIVNQHILSLLKDNAVVFLSDNMEDECYREYKLKRKEISVEPPKDTSLPFLAYFSNLDNWHIPKSKVMFLINQEV